MTASQLTSYGLAAVGGVLIVLAVVEATRRRVHIEAANTIVIKLARAGNLERAVKLCAAASGTYLDAVAASLEHSKAAVERSAIELAVHSAFDSIASPAAARWLRMNERGLLGVIAVGGGFALAISMDERSRALDTAAGLAALAGVWLLTRRSYYANAVAAARATVLPEIIASRVEAATGEAAAAVPDAIAASGVAATATDATATTRPVFRIFRGDRLIETQPLTHNVIKIGTMPAAHVHLSEDGGVSRMHAVVEIEPGRIQIIDLGSHTGTYVNGKQINKAVLRDGDQIVIGATRLELSLSGAEPVSQAASPASAPPAVAPPTIPAVTVAPPATSLASGACPLCRHTVIKTVMRDDRRFRTLVCAACGYAQEFADLDTLQ